MIDHLNVLFQYLFGPEVSPKHSHLLPRWLWLRALGLIFFSAFYSLLFQIRGLIGPDGILPAGRYLSGARQQAGALSYWYVPSVLWLGSGNHALMALSWIGLIASLLLVLNFWPRGMIAVCLLMYLSFVAAAQDFSSYQSDGMLLEAGFISLFFAPPGWRPRLGDACPPSRASLYLLRWEWFRIYFESGIVKLASHDPQWRNLTALDQYYANGPLPDWIGWYAQQLPHRFHASLTVATLVIELGLVWMLFMPRRFRRLCFFIVTPFQIGIILTANLAFLNYLALCLGVLLLDDEFLRRARAALVAVLGRSQLPVVQASAKAPGEAIDADGERPHGPSLHRFRTYLKRASLATSAVMLSWIGYNTTALLLLMLIPGFPLPTSPVLWLEPFRISNQYGLFAVMTRARYEIEFQGSSDGQTWVAYPFRYKPQDPREAPRLYAPYQPRFDWNLWFASLGGWREYPFVVRTEVQLLRGSPSVLSLFAGNPFPGKPPREVRAVLWQYWFTDLKVKREEGLWWTRKMLGLYAPTLEFTPDGSVGAVEMPDTQGIPPP
ncbi:MAG: lipase maturation factor family protein [Terriglobia bacterium]|jgi:hypothetical protein